MFVVCFDMTHTHMCMLIDVSYLTKYNGPEGRLMEVMLNWTENRVRICYIQLQYDRH